MVHVTGPIGVGKSTLVDVLARRLHLQELVESGSDNPYLDDFYADPAHWTYLCQYWFHEEALAQAHEVAEWQEGSPGFVWDRPPSERHDIFIPPLRAQGFLNNEQMRTLASMRDLANERAPTPLLVVGLRADVECVRTRILTRARVCERGLLEGSFLDEHVQRYDDWWAQQSPATFFAVDARASADEIADAVVDAFAHAVIDLEREEDSGVYAKSSSSMVLR